MSLADLQRTIDDSLAGASEFTRSLFEAGHWDAAQVQDYANEDGSMTVATIGRDGTPHTAIVIAGCHDGVFYFTASRRSALLGNLRRSPAIAFTISDKITGRGPAAPAGRVADVARIAPGVSTTLRMIIESGWDGYIYAVQPERLFATAS